MIDPRAKEAYDMSLQGQDMFDIAEKYSITVDEATKMVNGWADAVPSATNTEARRDEIRRVDRWTNRLEQEYREKNIAIDKAIASFCKLSERRSKLTGMDSISAAEAAALLNQAPPASVDAELQQLADELGFGAK